MDLVARGECQKCNGTKVSGMPSPEMARTIEQLFVLSRAWGAHPKIFHTITVPGTTSHRTNRNTQTILATCPCSVICQFYSHLCGEYVIRVCQCVCASMCVCECGQHFAQMHVNKRPQIERK